MKIDWSSVIDNRAYQFAAVGAICLGLVVFAVAQNSCGKHHEETAIVAGAKADASAERLKDALQQIDGLNRKVADLEEQVRILNPENDETKSKLMAENAKLKSEVEALSGYKIEIDDTVLFSFVTVSDICNYIAKK